MDKKQLGRAVKAAREKAGIERIELSELLGWQGDALQRLASIENGKTSIKVETMIEIEKILKLHPGALAGALPPGDSAAFTYMSSKEAHELLHDILKNTHQNIELMDYLLKFIQPK